MSILLDALKKSEAQRQLGKTPSIHSTVESPVAKREIGQQWIPLSLLALSAVAIAWFGWQQFRTPADVIDGSGAKVAAVSPVEENPVIINEPGQKKTEQEKARRKKARQEARQEARRETARQKKADGGSTDRTPVESFTAENKAQAGTAKKSRASKEKLERSFNSYNAENDAEKDTAPATTASAKTAPIVTDEAAQATPNKRSSRLEPHEAEPISFWQIPQSLRDGMPEFKISVLVYAENPQDRFLLINGQRLMEKEELDSGVVLDEIQPERAIFHYRKYKFFVKG
jgi:general secretion pathway protein B